MGTVLVTGAGVHVGRAIALGFAQMGYDVIVHANKSRDKLDALCEEIESHGVKASAFAADLSTQEGQEGLCQAVFSVCKSLDVLVHNAAFFDAVPFLQVSRGYFREMMGLNFEAPFFITQALQPLLQEGTSPCVINILDVAVHRPNLHYVTYTSSKGALETLTRCLAMELAPDIRVNAIAPYVVMYDGHIEETSRAQFSEKTPLKRNADPQEIVQAVLFMAQKAPYMTGHVLTLDGGYSLKP